MSLVLNVFLPNKRLPTCIMMSSNYCLGPNRVYFNPESGLMYKRLPVFVLHGRAAAVQQQTANCPYKAYTSPTH